MNYDFEFRQDLQKELKVALKKRRYQHTLGVSYTAGALAMRYGADVERALVAGLLHDCAKSMTDEELLHFAKEHDLPVSESEERLGFLLHAKVGAYLAQHKYDVDDEEILNAIRFHTTGRPDMTMMEKIIFTADYIEPNREDLIDLDICRREAFLDLDRAVYLIAEASMKHIIEKKTEMDPSTVETRDYYKQLMK